MQKSAKEVLEHSDDLEKQLDDFIKNGELDEAGKQGLIDELYEVAELDYLAKWDIPITGPGGKGFLGGQKLGRKEIKLWISKIDEISNGKAVLKIIDETNDTLKGVQAGFNPFTMEIFVKKGVTEYEIFHEFKHLEEFIKLEKDEYVKGMKAISGDNGQDLIRTYKREMYVYNQVLKESNKFNKEQLKHAYERNIKPVLDELESSGIDINKIKITK